jgi:hypothetical protein
MKYLKFFENNRTIQSLREMSDEYNKFLRDIKPIIIAKYYELANNTDYECDYGDQPWSGQDEDDLSLIQMATYNTGVQFLLQSFDGNGGINSSYYIDITDEELENMILGLETKKNNI